MNTLLPGRVSGWRVWLEGTPRPARDPYVAISTSPAPAPYILTLSTPTRWYVLVALDGTFSPIFNPPKVLRSAPRKQTSDLR